MVNWKHKFKLSQLLILLAIQSSLLMAGCGQKSALFLPEPSSSTTIGADENGPRDREDDEL